MGLPRQAIVLVSLVMVAASAGVASADDCAQFFWTGSTRAPVTRYRPHYLIGQGLEDVGMGNIVGSRIRYKWSTQAASCFAASSPNGYFVHPDFNRTRCAAGESCYPGFRPRRMSERLADLRNVVQQLSTPNPDATYQANLNVARAATYQVIDAIGAGPIMTMSLYDSFVVAYDQFLAQFDAMLDEAMPPDARTAVLDALCAPDSVSRMEELVSACELRGEACELLNVYLTIDMCGDYQDGATLENLLAQMPATRASLASERSRLADEAAAIRSLWDSLSGSRGALPPQPASCNVRFPFGTAQLPLSNFAQGIYGADLRYLYGDWQWSTFGLNTNTIKASRYVQDIIGLVRDCVGDLRYGRLDFRRRTVALPGGASRPETDAEYHARVLDDVVAITRQFATIERDYEALLRTHAPLVPATDVVMLKDHVSHASLRTRDLMANRTMGIGWLLVLMQDFSDAAERFTAANVLSRQLITAYQAQFPAMRNQVIDYMVTSTSSVLTEYGAFFSQEKRNALTILLARAVAETGNSDPMTAIANLTAISNDLHVQFETLWQANQPLGMMASQLTMIFGGCLPPRGPHPLLTYFGDLPVTARILEEGQNAPICHD